MGSGLPKVTTYKPKPRTNPLANSDRVQATEQQQQEKAWKFTAYLPNVQGGTQPKRVPMTVNGQAVQPQQPAPERAAKVPRERWVSSYAAQVQGPRNDGTVAGQAPYIGPYAGNAQRVPKYLDRNAKPYAPATQAEYQTWLNGGAFGSPTAAQTLNTAGTNPWTQARGFLGYNLNGTNPYAAIQSPSSMTVAENQSNIAQRGAWQAAMDYPDLAARRATAGTRTTLAGIGDEIARGARNVYDALKYNTGNRSYDAIERVRLNRGAPTAGPWQEVSTPSGYSGGGGGGGYPYGGGGYGGGGGGGGYTQQAAPWWYGLVNWRL